MSLYDFLYYTEYKVDKLLLNNALQEDAIKKNKK